MCSSEFKIYGNDYVKTMHQHFLGAESDTEHEIVGEWNLMKYQIYKFRSQGQMHNDIMEQKITPTEWCLCRIMRQKHDYMEL